MTTGIQPTHPALPEQPAAAKKPFYKKAWFIILAVLVVLGIAVSATGGDDDSADAPSAAPEVVADTVVEDGTDGAAEAAEVAEVEDVADAPAPDAPAPDQSNDVPREFTSALRKAESYSGMMHMSRAGVYDQLTSEYGEGFSVEAAQYAVDNVEADWNNNALEKARSYQDTMHMSPASIHEQLVSEYGEKFTVEEADYAMANLEQ